MQQRTAAAISADEIDPAPFASALLDWYAVNRRDLPWRASPGERPDPYRVWLSEIMLQQTTVRAVIPYYESFLRRWPSVEHLAAARLDEVLAAWAGLGYYARARNLHRCAQIAAARGGFPQSEAELLKLPGIGPYTAAAIAAIAFGVRAAAVDGNVERVVARLFAVEEPLPGAKARLRSLAGLLVPANAPGDFTQAMMDLGATICTPRQPSCLRCPVAEFCRGRLLGIAESLPRKAVRSERPLRTGRAFLAVLLHPDGPRILLRQRPEKGLLARMLEVPGTDWTEGPAAAVASPPFPADWRKVPGTVTHIFTHFRLELTLDAAQAGSFPGAGTAGGAWVAIGDLGAAAIPGVMRKVIGHGLEWLGHPSPFKAHAAGRAARSASRVSTVERSARPSTRAGRK